MNQPTSSTTSNGATVRELVWTDDHAWNQLVAGSPQGNAFLRSDWLRMLAETSRNDLQLLRLGVFNAREELRAGWAFLYRERHGVRVSEVFDLFYCGPMLAGDLARGERARVASALIEGAAERMDQTLAETHPTFTDVRPFMYQGWSVVPEYTHLWDLADPDAVLRSMNREKRAEIRRARERFRIGPEPMTDAAFRHFMELYRTAMAKFSWYPPQHWEELQRERIRWMEDREGCRFFAVRDADGELLAGLLALLSPEDRTAYYWRMGYGAAGRKAEVVPALYWEAAQPLCAGPLRFVNFGSSPQPALSQFKDYLGADATTHYRLIQRKPSLRLQLHDWNALARDRARRLVGGSAGLRTVYQKLQRLSFFSFALSCSFGEMLPVVL